jgi:hypothetical protein
MVKALLKSSLIASAVFAAAWFRGSSTAAMIVRYFLLYGVLITISSMVVGLPLARLIERLKIGRWWSYLASAAATGALLGTILSSHPTIESRAAPTPGIGEQETSVENPFAITFSPWTRSQPGFAGLNPPIQWSDYKGTIASAPLSVVFLGAPFGFSIDTERGQGLTRLSPNAFVVALAICASVL